MADQAQEGTRRKRFRREPDGRGSGGNLTEEIQARARGKGRRRGVEVWRSGRNASTQAQARKRLALSTRECFCFPSVFSQNLASRLLVYRLPSATLDGNVTDERRVP